MLCDWISHAHLCVCIFIHSMWMQTVCHCFARLFHFPSAAAAAVLHSIFAVWFSMVCVCFFFRCLRVLPIVQVFGRKYAFQCILDSYIFVCGNVPICVCYACASVVILCHCYRFTLSLCHRFTWTWVLLQDSPNHESDSVFPFGFLLCDSGKCYDCAIVLYTHS